MWRTAGIYIGTFAVSNFSLNDVGSGFKCSNRLFEVDIKLLRVIKSDLDVIPLRNGLNYSS